MSTSPQPPPAPLSAFLNPGTVTTPSSLAVLHLKRDLLLPIILTHHDPDNEGYDEGRVTNTRFGSFPHSTLIGLPWGSQVRASRVDTGSRGRKSTFKPSADAPHKKRKQDVAEIGSPPNEEEQAPLEVKAAVAAESGFVHVLPPTPETWTVAIPHRTQVVYTPDYSYILHRLRVRPGSVLVEAGAGSGSFTHAAARAVCNGFEQGRKRKRGRVMSFEFHEQRREKLVDEIREHGLEGVVKVRGRDVCSEGFTVGEDEQEEGEEEGVDAIFLDLPAPWLALPHLTRTPATRSRFLQQHGTNGRSPSVEMPAQASMKDEASSREEFKSPLNPRTTARICTFSPCIEQVQRTIATLRQLGWLDIEMVEIAQRRIEVRRERVGLSEEGVKGANVTAATVDEAIARLREVEGRFRTFHDDEKKKIRREDDEGTTGAEAGTTPKIAKKMSEAQKLLQEKGFAKGRLIHRVEPEIKNHTSYLVFALLPQEWTAEDEEAAKQAWPVEGKVVEKVTNHSHRAKKRAERAAKEAATEAVVEEKADEVGKMANNFPGLGD